MAKVKFQPSGKEVQINGEPSVLELAQNNDVEIDTSCGGSGSCGACRVIIAEGLGKLKSRNRTERAMAEDRKFADNERLSCQIEPVDGLVVKVP